MITILWIIAVVLVIAGIVQLFQGEMLFGIALIVVGFLVGPGGVSLFASTGLAMAGLLPVGRTLRQPLTPRPHPRPVSRPGPR